MDEILKIAPALAKSQRAGRSLADQFIYRFGYGPETTARCMR